MKRSSKADRLSGRPSLYSLEAIASRLEAIATEKQMKDERSKRTRIARAKGEVRDVGFLVKKGPRGMKASRSRNTALRALTKPDQARRRDRRPRRIPLEPTLMAPGQKQKRVETQAERGCSCIAPEVVDVQHFSCGPRQPGSGIDRGVKWVAFIPDFQ